MKNEWEKAITQVEISVPTPDGKSVAEKITLEVPCTIHTPTGEEYLGDEAFEIMERVKARHMGLMQPEEIRSLRESLQMTQKELSDLLYLGAKNFSRWENGRERPSRSINLLLRALEEKLLTPATIQNLKRREAGRSRIIPFPKQGEEMKPYTMQAASRSNQSPTKLKKETLRAS